MIEFYYFFFLNFLVESHRVKLENLTINRHKNEATGVMGHAKTAVLAGANGDLDHQAAVHPAERSVLVFGRAI